MRRVLLVAALLLAGCGGEQKAEYERGVRAIVADVRAHPDTIGTAGARLGTLDPPGEVAGPHRDLIAAFDAIASAQARGIEPSDAVIDRLLQARRDFAARDYDIGIYGPLS